MRFLVRSDVVWDIMMMNKAFKKFKDESIGIVGKESKFRFGSIDCFSEEKALIFFMVKEV